MDKPYDSQEQHFNLPHIRSIGTERPMQWLRMGWNDMRENLGASLSYGVILAAIGYLILSYAADKPYLFMAAISGFTLIRPIDAGRASLSISLIVAGCRIRAPSSSPPSSSIRLKRM